MSYTFSTAHPPLLAVEHGAVLDVLPSSLTRDFGVAFNSDIRRECLPHDPPPLRRCFDHCQVDFSFSRKQYWKIVTAPYHYANTQSIKVTHTKGYTKTDKINFENVLEGSLGLEGVRGLKGTIGASIKATLKMSEDLTTEWREEFTESSEYNIEGGSTYVRWSLIDSLSLIKTVYKPINIFQPAGQIMFVDSAVFNVILSIYEDKMLDKDQSTLNIMLASPRLKIDEAFFT